MARKLRNQFKLVKIKAHSFNAEGSTDASDRLEELYMILEAKKVDAVNAARKALQAAQLATVKQAEAIAAEVSLIAAAAEYDNRIAGERVWMPYKEDDQLVFEGVTERLLRNNFRAQQAAIGKSMTEDGSNTLDPMFEDEDDDEDDE